MVQRRTEDGGWFECGIFAHTILTMMKESCLVSSAVRDQQKCVSKSVSRAGARPCGTYFCRDSGKSGATSAGLERRGQYHHPASLKTAHFQTKLLRGERPEVSQVSHCAVGDVARTDSRTDGDGVGDDAVHLLLHHHPPTTPRRRRTKIAAKRVGRHRRRAAILHIPIAP